MARHLGEVLADRQAPDVRRQSRGPRAEAVDGRKQEGSADLLVVGAIATGNPAQPLVDAMAVRDGRIVALGSAADLDGLRDADTELVESGDGVVIPGLIEPHMHLWSTGCSTAGSTVRTAPTRASMMSSLGSPTRRRKPRPVSGSAANSSTRACFQGNRNSPPRSWTQSARITPWPSRTRRCTTSTSTRRCSEIAGITAETPDPPGGTFYRADGKLTGVVGELAGLMGDRGAHPRKSQEDYAAAMRAIMEVAASRA